MATFPVDTSSIMQNMTQSEAVQRKLEVDSLRKRLGDARTEEQQLRESCEGFESLFIQKMWEQMRKTLPKEGYLHSKDEETYQSMFDVELAKKMSASGGIGLADMLYQQLSQKLSSSARKTTGTGRNITMPDAPVDMAFAAPPPPVAMPADKKMTPEGLYAPMDGVSVDEADGQVVTGLMGLPTPNNADAAMTAHVASMQVAGSAQKPAENTAGRNDLPRTAAAGALEKALDDLAAQVELESSAVAAPVPPATAPAAPVPPATAPAAPVASTAASTISPALPAVSTAAPAVAPATSAAPTATPAVSPVAQPSAPSTVSGQVSSLRFSGGQAAGGKVLRHFGWEKSASGQKWHNDMLIGGTVGQGVSAPLDGKVVFVGDKSGLGPSVVLQHGKGYQTIYGNVEAEGLELGSTVKAGTDFAKVLPGGVSAAGGEDFALMHLLMKRGEMPLDPESTLKRLTTAG